MRQKQVWRYYCDHCKKGGCGKAAMVKHELHCIRNPHRKCRMCDTAELSQEPIDALIRVYTEDGLKLKGLRELAQGCPACMLSAVIQHQKSENYDPDESEEFFDYKAECSTFWAEINANKREWAGY